ncbi:dephospho-CoA kinase [Asticcacaulis sp. 201]|uniref:dephospho-CoA kinase n=1 Tax=Asticcacaulis sp. 201 TaxID=3028787 RepID=UPI002916FE4D|nr:dephospho-CoA kinase [Asticcacaulis sp. 201]MDV6331445.1 dephospho-CoA kinase [Asticcacaulis sp. 201]
MITLGLTGSIGMGKSTIAAMFADEGVPVWDADGAVHRLYAESQTVKDQLVAAFGDILTDGVVDRVKLSAALNGEAANFERLNAIVHPATVSDRQHFVAQHGDAPLIVVDIPLLYETGAEASLDKVLVVSAPADVQAARVLARAGMTAEKFATILARQMPDADKRARADFIIDTSQSLDDCRNAVRALIEKLA